MMEVGNPLSSMNTSRLASKRLASHRHKPPGLLLLLLLLLLALFLGYGRLF